MPAKVTRDELLGGLKEFQKDLERTPRTRDMAENGPYAPQTYIKEFGSWTEALEAAGLEPNQTRIPNEDLVDELHRLADELDRTPTYQDVSDHGKYSPTTYDRRFGNWAEALSAAGFDEETADVDRLTDDELLDDLRTLADDLGRPPTKREMGDRGPHSWQVYETRFGDWDSALEAADLDPSKTKSAVVSADGVSDDELLDDLRAVAEDHDGLPGHKAVSDEGDYDPCVYVDRFGSWMEALEAAGIDVEGEEDDGRRVSTTELLDNLCRLAFELGKTPSQEEMNQHGPHSANTYNERFGGWNEALEIVGLDPNRSRRTPTSDEELLDELRRLADELGHTPRYKDMAENGEYSATTYERRFGGWNPAIEAAGLEPNS